MTVTRSVARLVVAAVAALALVAAAVTIGTAWLLEQVAVAAGPSVSVLDVVLVAGVVFAVAAVWIGMLVWVSELMATARAELRAEHELELELTDEQRERRRAVRARRRELAGYPLPDAHIARPWLSVTPPPRCCAFWPECEHVVAQLGKGANMRNLHIDALPAGAELVDPAAGAPIRPTGDGAGVVVELADHRDEREGGAAS